MARGVGDLRLRIGTEPARIPRVFITLKLDF